MYRRRELALFRVEPFQFSLFNVRLIRRRNLFLRLIRNELRICAVARHFRGEKRRPLYRNI